MRSLVLSGRHFRVFEQPRRTSLQRRRTPISIWVAVALLGPACTSQAGPRLPDSVSEASGIVASRRHPGVFWTHNDSGDESRFFAVAADGKLLATVAVVGARNVDWEDIAIDDAGFLYLGDHGNNQSARQDLTIYRVPEPDPTQAPTSVAPDRVIRFHYPEQVRWPDPEEAFDAEALFWAQGKLYLLTKSHKSATTTLYRFDDLSGARDLPLTRVGTFETQADKKKGRRVTGADVTPDGRFLAVLTYHALYLFERPVEGDDYLSKPLRRIELDPEVFEQCEAVAWDGADLVVTNEQRAIFRLPRALEWKGDQWKGR
jgi:hypothetical protein